MVKKALILLGTLMLAAAFSGSSILRSTERSFVLALGADCVNGEWTVCARIPTYQSDGGYVTLQGRGGDLSAALIALDHAAPMQLHLGQTRAIVLGETLAYSSQARAALQLLLQLREMRQDAVLLITPDPISDVCSAMRPPSGTRLSKSLDEMISTRKQQGTIPVSTLADALRHSDRQSLIIARLRCMSADYAADEVRLMLSGCYVTDRSQTVVDQLNEDQCQQLLLMLGQWKRGAMRIASSTCRIAEASARIKLDPPNVNVSVSLRLADSIEAPDEAASALQQSLLALCRRLSASGSDALGLGRQAIRYFVSQEQWDAADWPSLFQQLTWSVEVDIHSPLTMM